jgi:hypothetical protein
LAKFELQRRVISRISASFGGATPPEVLVGSRTWPEVSLSLLAAPTDPLSAEEMGNPESLYGKSLEEVIDLRSQLVRCGTRVNVRIAREPPRLLEEIREAALSVQGLPLEVRLRKVPEPRMRFDGFLAPTGPSAALEHFTLSGNPRVPPRVENLVADTDAKAETSVLELYRSGLSSYYLARLLSLGMLGRRLERVLVPSRWSTTAVDSIISKDLGRGLLGAETVDGPELFTAEYVGNRYAVLLLPSALSFEMVEIVMPGCVYLPWGTEPWIGSDSEGWRGRSSYPSIGGGYYAAKLPVYEHLARRGRQAFALVVREVTPGYWAPVGSWKIREALRQALAGQPLRFPTVQEALSRISEFIKMPPDRWLPTARRFLSLQAQKKLEC